jgi:hypothetical protein
VLATSWKGPLSKWTPPPAESCPLFSQVHFCATLIAAPSAHRTTLPTNIYDVCLLCEASFSRLALFEKCPPVKWHTSEQPLTNNYPAPFTAFSVHTLSTLFIFRPIHCISTVRGVHKRTLWLAERGPAGWINVCRDIRGPDKRGQIRWGWTVQVTFDRIQARTG